MIGNGTGPGQALRCRRIVHLLNRLAQILLRRTRVPTEIIGSTPLNQNVSALMNEIDGVLAPKR